MEVKLDEFVKQLTDFIKSEAKTETIIGDSFTLGEFTCVPVARIGMGFGSGGGAGDAPKAGKGEGGGGGAGVGIEPIGFLVTRKDEISFIPTQKSKGGLAAAFEKIPDLVEKMMDKKKKKENT